MGFKCRLARIRNVDVFHVCDGRISTYRRDALQVNVNSDQKSNAQSFMQNIYLEIVDLDYISMEIKSLGSCQKEGVEYSLKGES